MKEVLITIPTDGRKDYVLDEFITYLNHFTPYGEVIVINTGDKKYEARLKEKIPYACVVNLTKTEEMTKTEFMYILREKQRELFLTSKMKYHMMLDSDVLVPIGVFLRMFASMKEGFHWVGPWYAMGYSRKGYCYPADARPLVGNAKILTTPGKEGLDNLTREQLITMPDAFETEVIPLGCSMLSRDIMNNVKFEWCKLVQIGEDVMWYGNASEKGYKALCLNEEVDHISNGVSRDYYDGTSRFEAVMRRGDDICKKIDMKELRESKIANPQYVN